MSDSNVTVLWVSNGRRKKTGYGTQSNIWLPRIKKAAGFDVVAFNCTENMGEPTIDQDGIVTLYRKYENYGNDVYAQHMVASQAAFSVGLFNGWLIGRDYGKYMHAHWAPIDSDPLRQDEEERMRRYCTWVIAMSHWGEAVLRDRGFDPLFVPHGIESDVFKPIDRTEARANLQQSIDHHEPMRGYPCTLADKFVVAMVGENNITPARKGWFEALRAFKAFHQRHPDSVLYLFTQLDKPDGINIKRELIRMKFPPGAVAMVNQYLHSSGAISDEWLNDLYNTADVFFGPSHAEGFFLPAMEAQMAGCPVILTDCSALTEICLSGQLVPGQPYIAKKGWHWTMPYHEALVEALETAYQRRGQMVYRERARTKALAYDADRVWDEYMLPALKRISEEAKEGLTGRILRKQQHLEEVRVGDVTLTVRAGSWDAKIAETVQREYFPDIIDYSKVKRAVDVGAHIGSWTLWVKSQAPEARIVAIEAMPENAELLRKNVNHGMEGVTVLEGMCAYTPGEYDMLIDPTNTGGQTLVKRGEAVPRLGEYTIRKAYEGKHLTLEDALTDMREWEMIWQEKKSKPYRGYRGNTIEYPTITLEGCRDWADVLKLDCEGGEFDILDNAPMKQLCAFRYIVGEYHTEMGDIGATLRRLEPWFEVKAIRPFDDLFGLFCLERRNDVQPEK